MNRITNFSILSRPVVDMKATGNTIKRLMKTQKLCVRNLQEKAKNLKRALRAASEPVEWGTAQRSATWGRGFSPSGGKNEEQF